MSAKLFLFQDEARLKLQEGLRKLALLISPTLGPKGNHVALDNAAGSAKITSDSSAILEEVEFKDQFENFTVELVRKMAEEIKAQTGDGVATGIVILNALMQEALKHLAAGASPAGLKKEIENELDKALNKLSSLAVRIKTEKEIEKIALSAGGSIEIGQLLSEALKKAGEGGLVSIEEGRGLKSTLELARGFEIDRGYLSPYFCTNLEKLTVEMENPYFLITDKKLASVQELLPVLQNLNAIGGALIIIAEEIEGDALATLVINKLKGILKVAAIKAPSFGEERKQLLEDLACLTGARVVAEETGGSLVKTTLEDLGRAEKVFIGKETTNVINGQGAKDLLEKRILQLEKQNDLEEGEYEKDKLKKRIARLKGNAAVIKVGAASETELKQKKALFEESLAAVRAALEEGVAAGGGLAFVRAAQALDKTSFGGRILQKALLAPMETLLKNSSQESALYLEKIQKRDDLFGYNLETEKFEDLFQAGVLDPVKVLKNSLKKAASTAILMLFSEVLIGEDKS
ncbi:MAG: chaperonin GroEL [Parachlamydiales bacterium]|jgi:chaperonin GroEL